MANSDVLARKSAEKLAHHLYRYETPYGEGVCVYCGETATTLDHVPPLSYAASIMDILPNLPKRPRFTIWPACRDCNCRLSGFLLSGLRERRREIRARLSRKYRRLLGEYDWSDEELARFGRNLRSAIEHMEHKRRRIVSRLRFPEWER